MSSSNKNTKNNLNSKSKTVTKNKLGKTSRQKKK
jgi:hypothetical protein